MWIVRLALRRPYTFAVLALLLLIIGPLSIVTTPVDIFPNIDIPVVSIVWQYQGFSAEQMADRIITITERALTTTVDNIDHIESNSLSGVAVVKIYFQPQVNLASAIAQVTAISQAQLKHLPDGTTPPFIIDYNASSVPILQLGVSGKGLSEQELNDYSLNFIRTQLVTIRGAAIPYPYGGKQRQVQVDLDLRALQAKGLSPSDVTNTIANQNLILPSGTIKVGTYEYQVDTNSAPTTIEGLNDLPIKQVNGAMVYVHDVAHVRDGFPPQTNIVRVDGQRAALITILKNGNSSTLDIIKGIFNKLPSVKASIDNPHLKITPLSDQSIFVRGAISGVVHEAVIAACLTGLMILVFLGSWRSTLIIAVSIPLSILVSLILLGALGETINIMTLGGLALAVGILVDDATVEIENINRNLEEGKEIEQAILDGAAQIAVPAFVSTLSICIVFVPMFFLGGVAKYLFVPLAEAVVFAMLASYFLSRTIVPTMAKFLLVEHDPEAQKQKERSRNPFLRFQLAFEHRFEQFRSFYHGLLGLAVAHSSVFLILFVIFCVGSFVLYPWLGQDFFPSVDAGQFKLHVRARTGTRIEETARLCDEIDRAIRREIPARELVTIIDNIGIPYSGLNLSYTNTGVVGSADADITVSLAKDHRPTEAYVDDLRGKLAAEFPGVTFYSLPVDMTTQILNFGLPAPIDVQIIGHNEVANHAFAEKLMQEIKYVPGTADLHIQQPFNEPRFFVDVDRSRAQDIGLTQRDVAGSLLVALSGSFQTQPTFWLNPKNGVTYNVAAQTPQYSLDSLDDLESVPITTTATPNPDANFSMLTPAAQMGAKPIQILGNLASITRGEELATVTHYDIQPVVDIYGNINKTDLRSVADKIRTIIDRHRKELPAGSRLVVRGQVQTMRSSFVGLVSGLFFSILLVYLLIVVNFQSWLDPFIIIAALPAALAGIVWMLFLTGTHISVPALTGSIMCMGVATANSILVVSFAKEQLEINDGDAIAAALAAGFTRFRPVLMTALAMIIGMVPMSLGLGDGGEQNAPLGRAVIGGLVFATVATLFFVPTFFSVVHGALERRRRARASRNGRASTRDNHGALDDHERA